MRLRRYLPLFAQAALVINPPPKTDQFDHIIVDEAQDVTPLEWRIVDRLNRETSWTLVGDMNQRRADCGHRSWRQLAVDLALTDDDGQINVHTLERGYRSTQPILDFASALLPRGERGAKSLRSAGAPVRVVRASSAVGLGRLAVHLADDLSAAYSSGTSAIITSDPAKVVVALSKAGWRRDGSFESWSKAEQRLALRTPESARGVEFDAVVVVEPSSFPTTLGMNGPLYTSLTRG